MPDREDLEGPGALDNLPTKFRNEMQEEMDQLEKVNDLEIHGFSEEVKVEDLPSGAIKKDHQVSGSSIEVDADPG